jgi:hypothetical protein
VKVGPSRGIRSPQNPQARLPPLSFAHESLHHCRDRHRPRGRPTLAASRAKWPRAQSGVAADDADAVDGNVPDPVGGGFVTGYPQVRPQPAPAHDRIERHLTVLYRAIMWREPLLTSNRPPARATAPGKEFGSEIKQVELLEDGAGQRATSKNSPCLAGRAPRRPMKKAPLWAPFELMRGWGFRPHSRSFRPDHVHHSKSTT